MEKVDASQANSFTVDERLLPRSFMYIKKNSGPKTESWGTPACIGDTWKLKKNTLKSAFSDTFNEIPVDWILYINPSCQTQSKALDISKKRPLTSSNG